MVKLEMKMVKLEMKKIKLETMKLEIKMIKFKMMTLKLFHSHGFQPSFNDIMTVIMTVKNMIKMKILASI